MKIMGLTETAYYSSWLTHYSIIFSIIGLVCTWELTHAAFLASNFFLVFLWLFLFYCVQMARAVFFSSLFSRAKFGITLGIVLYFVEEIFMDNLIPKP